MPNFFFDVTMNGSTTKDDLGTSLISSDAARDEAVASICELINRKDGAPQTIAIAVSDEHHNLLFTSSLSLRPS